MEQFVPPMLARWLPENFLQFLRSSPVAIMCIPLLRVQQVSCLNFFLYMTELIIHTNLFIRRDKQI
jgi:hypothetical protein